MIFTVVSILGLTILAFLVLISSTVTKQNKFFFVMLSASLSVFIGVLFISNEPKDPLFDIISNRALYFFIPFITTSIYLVISSIIDPKFKPKAALALLPILISPLAFSNFVIDTITYLDKTPGYMLERGFLYVPFLIVSLSPIVYSIVSMIRIRSDLTGSRKLKITIVLFGLIIVSFGMTTTNVFLPIVLGNSSTGSIAPVWIFIWVVSLYYAIARYRLFGIRYISGKVLFFFTNAVSLYAFFNLGYWLHVSVWGGEYTIESITFGLFISLVIFTIFNGFLNSSERVIDDIFGLRDASTQKFLDHYLKIISTSLQIDTITDQTFQALHELLDVEKVGIVIFHDKTHEITYTKYSENVTSRFGTHYGISEILDYWGDMSSKEIILRDELLEYADNREDLTQERRLRIGRFVAIMHDEDIEAILPLNRAIKLNGVLLLKQRERSDAYSLSELNLLEQIISNVSIAFGRAVLYKEVTEFNETLRSKIDEATKDLQSKNSQLQEVRRRERDMMDIMGHELRTPLSIIKIKQSLLRSKAEKHPEQFTRDEFLQVDEAIRDALEREIRLLETMLSSTKIDAGRMELNLDEVELKRLIDNSILGHTSMAEDHKLELSVEPFDETLSIFADPVRIAEVLDNFVNNAIKYTPKGSVKISVETDEKFVTVHVKDTGIGISPDAVKHLGEKWYRENQYIEHVHENGDRGSNGNNIVRPGGSGLGLYVAFGLIKQMGGSVNVESELGKGSTFSFTVPRFVGQEAKMAGDKGKDLFKRMKLEAEVVEGDLFDTGTSDTEKTYSDNGNLNKSSS